jgi:cytochrome c peroxidase
MIHSTTQSVGNLDNSDYPVTNHSGCPFLTAPRFKSTSYPPPKTVLLNQPKTNDIYMQCSALGTISNQPGQFVSLQSTPTHSTYLKIGTECQLYQRNWSSGPPTNYHLNNCKSSCRILLKGEHLEPGKKYYIMAAQKRDYNSVADAIRKIIPRPGYDDGSIGPVLVRLAWHASGTYDAASGTGGSNGATMRYELEAKDDANNGLEHARKFLEPIKQQFPWITYADLWTFAGAVAIEFMDGPKIAWKPGRVDYVDETNVPPNGRLPDGAQGQGHLRDIFYRMGFNDQEIVALCGAHNLGRTHADRSGFDGPWVPSPTRFSNTYFKLLLNEEWHLGKSPAGVEQFYDEDKELMMLPADMSLIKDPKFREWVEKYAEDKDLFYDDFAKVFAKLLELGGRRGPNGLAQVNYLNKQNHAKGKL